MFVTYIGNKIGINVEKVYRDSDQRLGIKLLDRHAASTCTRLNCS